MQGDTTPTHLQRAPEEDEDGGAEARDLDGEFGQRGDGGGAHDAGVVGGIGWLVGEGCALRGCAQQRLYIVKHWCMET